MKFSVHIVLVFIAADAVAAIVGGKVGKFKIFGNKTIEGTVAFILTCFIGSYLLTSLNTTQLTIISVVCGLSELYGGDADNILTLFSYYGVRLLFVLIVKIQRLWFLCEYMIDRQNYNYFQSKYPKKKWTGYRNGVTLLLWVHWPALLFQPVTGRAANTWYRPRDGNRSSNSWTNSILSSWKDIKTHKNSILISTFLLRELFLKTTSESKEEKRIEWDISSYEL